MLSLTFGALLAGSCAFAVRMGWLPRFQSGSTHEPWRVTGALIVPVIPARQPKNSSPHILVAAKHQGRATLALIRLEDGTTVWERDLPITGQSASTPGQTAQTAANAGSSASVDGLAAGDEMVFAVVGNRLHALARETGAPVWEATLAAGMDMLCDRCLRVQGGRVIVWTAAGMLQAFDARTGRSAWNRPGTAPRQLHEMGDDLVLLDAYEGNGIVSIVETKTGRNRRQVFPVCTADRDAAPVPLDADAELVVDAADRSIYVTYGVDALCLQKWDAASGRMAWQRPTEDGASRALPAQTGVVVSLGGELHMLNTASGRSDHVLTAPGAELRGIAADATLLLAVRLLHAEQRYEIAGVDAATLTERWHYALQRRDEILEDDGRTHVIDSQHDGFAVHGGPGGIIAIHVRQKHIEVVLLDSATGANRRSRRTDLPAQTRSRAFDTALVGWTDHTAVLIVDGRLALVDSEGGHVFFW